MLRFIYSWTECLVSITGAPPVPQLFKGILLSYVFFMEESFPVNQEAYRVVNIAGHHQPKNEAIAFVAPV